MPELKNPDLKEIDNQLLSADDLVTHVISIEGNPTLSHVGYASIVNQRGDISVTELEYKETEEGILVWGCGKNFSGVQRWASHMQPRSTDKNEEPAYDWTKAFNGFQRNLFEIFVHGDPLIDKTIEKWKTEKGTNKDTKQNQNTKRQQPTNGNQQTADNDSKPANGNPKPANNNQQSTEQASDSAEKEKVIEGARELFKHLHTDAVANEINIKKGEIFAEAQKLWGSSDDWTIEMWEEYIKAIADFHNRQGVIYDNLRPKPKDNAGENTETA